MGALSYRVLPLSRYIETHLTVRVLGIGPMRSRNFSTVTLQEIRLAARNVRRHLRRSLLALATIGFGVVAYMLAGGFVHWVLEKTRDATIYSQLGHIQITRPGYFTKGIADPYSYLLPADFSEVIRAAGVEQLVTVAPRLTFTGLVSADERTIAFAGEGVDPKAESYLSLAINIIDGRNLDEAPTQSAIVGKGLAAAMELSPGVQIVLLATTAEGGLNAVEAEVVGIFASTVKAYDDATLRIPIALARTLIRTEGATTWAVLLKDTEYTDRTVSRLTRELPEADFEVTPWSALAEYYHKTVELFSRQVGIMKLMIGTIIVLSILNILSMTVAERTSEIGTAMALGTPRATILRQFLLEGTVLGTLGGALGCLVGLLLAVVISHVGIPMPPAPGMTEGYIGEIWVPASLIVDAFLLAFTTTLVASLLPAWRASRLEIVDALRQQR